MIGEGASGGANYLATIPTGADTVVIDMAALQRVADARSTEEHCRRQGLSAASRVQNTRSARARCTAWRAIQEKILGAAAARPATTAPVHRGRAA